MVDEWSRWISKQIIHPLEQTLGYCKPTFACQLLDRDLAEIDLN